MLKYYSTGIMYPYVVEFNWQLEQLLVEPTVHRQLSTLNMSCCNRCPPQPHLTPLQKTHYSPSSTSAVVAQPRPFPSSCFPDVAPQLTTPKADLNIPQNSKLMVGTVCTCVTNCASVDVTYFTARGRNSYAS